MKKRILISLALVIVMLAGLFGLNVAAARQNASPLPPAILSFAADVDEVTFAEAEAGSVNTTLSWQTANLSAGFRLALETRHYGDWQALDPNAVLQPNGTQVAPVLHPHNFGSPSYRLAIYDGDDNIIDQQMIVIDYAPAPINGTPQIQSFNANSAGVDATALANGTARIPVSWYVSNRLPNSTLLFEQVFGNGSTLEIDQPRTHLWVDSTGVRDLTPTYPQNANTVSLQLRVVDAVSGQVYDSRSLSVPINGTPATPAPVNDASIAYFRSAPTIALPGAFALEWQIHNASYATIEWQHVNGTYVSDAFMPAQHVMGVELGAVKVSDRGTHVFRLIATNANGQPLYNRAGNLVQAFLEINAAPQNQPQVRAFVGSPNPAAYGDVITLTWDVTNVDSVSLTRLGPDMIPVEALGDNFPAAGRATWQMPEVVIPEDFRAQVNFRLIGVVDGTEAIIRDLYIPLESGEINLDPFVASFTASPNPAEHGSLITVGWEVVNAGTVSITRIDSNGNREVIGEGLNPSGSTQIQLPIFIQPEPGFTMTLYLRAVGFNDEVVEARTAVEVLGVEREPLPEGTMEALPVEPAVAELNPEQPLTAAQ